MKKPILYGTSRLPLSAAYRCGDLVFVSGQASVNLDTGEIVPGTLAEEMERSIMNVRRVLEAAGARWEDIIKVGCYLRQESDLAEYNRLYRNYFQEPYPARTTLTGCLPRSILFEIDCVACLSAPPVQGSNA